MLPIFGVSKDEWDTGEPMKNVLCVPKGTSRVEVMSNNKQQKINYACSLRYAYWVSRKFHLITFFSWQLHQSVSGRSESLFGLTNTVPLSFVGWGNYISCGYDDFKSEYYCNVVQFCVWALLLWNSVLCLAAWIVANSELSLTVSYPLVSSVSSLLVHLPQF